MSSTSQHDASVLRGDKPSSTTATQMPSQITAATGSSASSPLREIRIRFCLEATARPEAGSDWVRHCYSKEDIRASLVRCGLCENDKETEAIEASMKEVFSLPAAYTKFYEWKDSHLEDYTKLWDDKQITALNEMLSKDFQAAITRLAGQASSGVATGVQRALTTEKSVIHLVYDREVSKFRDWRSQRD